MRHINALLRFSPILFLLLIIGCGGGGGSHGGGTGTTASTGVLSVFANFTPGTAGGPTGVSEVLKVTTLDGTLVQTSTVTSSGLNQAPKQATFSNLPNANLILTATLFSGSNGAGTAVGTLQYVFPGNTSTAVTTAMAQTVTHLAIGPSPVAVAKGGSQQLVATSTNDAGDLVFEATNPNWLVASGSSVGTITSQGVFSGTGVGQATVNATSGSLTATAQVSVTGIANGTWTIMVFLNSANDLDTESLLNIHQIEQVAQTETSPTRCVIQWKLTPAAGVNIASHPFWGTRRYLATNNNLEFLQDLGTNTDMGSASTLKEFVSWTTKNYPADHYMLILWDHGNGWFFRNALPSAPRWRGISYDFETGNHIDVNQIAQAVSPTHLDILSFDACLMQMLEVQNQVSSVADYMVCSEDNTPGPGYPYDKSFGQFFTTPNASTQTLAKGIVDGFINSYDTDPSYSSTSLSHSVVDLTKVGAVKTALDKFSTDLIAGGTVVGPNTQNVRLNLLNYAPGDGYNYYDLGAIAQGFAGKNISSTITQSANALATAEQNAVVYSRTDGHSPNSTGIALEFGNSVLFNQYATEYNLLSLAQQTHWSQFLGSSVLNP